MREGIGDGSSEAENAFSESENLKIEVLKLISRALESKAENPTGILDFDHRNGVDFYEEVTKFEVDLLRQALLHTKGNQRAAARLLGLKATTLNSKVKAYNLDLRSKDFKKVTSDRRGKTD
jgi:Response regulator containing CheY-like receiver, AAA-type ATPase, and DNA-binding domains